MRQINELREYIYDHTRHFNGEELLRSDTSASEMIELVNEIENILECEYMRLPQDANGWTLHVGDWIHVGRSDDKVRIVGISQERVFWESDFQHFLEGDLSECVSLFHDFDVAEILTRFAVACEDAGFSGPSVKSLALEYSELLQARSDE